MMKFLSIYIQQRFSFLLWNAIALCLFIMTNPFSNWDGSSFVVFGILLLQLFLFRLGDDLFQIHNDKHKPNRIYTKQRAHTILIRWWLFSFCLLEVFLLFVYIKWALYLFVFVLTLFALYFFLVKYNFWASLLPLVKYPIFGIVCTTAVNVGTQHISMAQWSLLFVAVVFLEAAFDKHFMKGVVHKIRYSKTTSLLVLFIIFVHIALTINHVI